MNKTKFCSFFYFILIFIILSAFATTHEVNEEEIAQTVDEKIITCGSAIRIQNVMTKFNLFSNQLTWGSGSGQQIVTSVKETDNTGSLFIIKEEMGAPSCETGTPIKCNDIIRLEHVNTGKNIHSHNYKSFITDSQEVSAFGDGGYGDFLDNWKLLCYNSKEDVVRGKTNFFLEHVATQQYLYVNIRNSLFNEHNCRGCPIINHREVSCTTNKDKQSLWKVIGGLIYKSNDEDDQIYQA